MREIRVLLFRNQERYGYVFSTYVSSLLGCWGCPKWPNFLVGQVVFWGFLDGCFGQVSVGMCWEKFLDIPIQRLMKRKFWHQYIFIFVHYYPSIRYNLVILCWNVGQGTPVHDHPASECMFKVCDGAICETRFVSFHHNHPQPTLGVLILFTFWFCKVRVKFYPLDLISLRETEMRS